MNDFHPFRPTACLVNVRPHAPLLFALALFLWGGPVSFGQTSMSEYQVKALFLLNFAKYVDWAPATTPGAPLVIGVLGQDNLDADLQRAAQDQSIDGRPIVVKHLSSTDALAGCSILFIDSSEDSQLDQLLEKTGALPILTVGENDSFLRKGGIINFSLKNGKIHLQINLKIARHVKLQISSRLLSVADSVTE